MWISSLTCSKPNTFPKLKKTISVDVVIKSIWIEVWKRETELLTSVILMNMCLASFLIVMREHTWVLNFLRRFCIILGTYYSIDLLLFFPPWSTRSRCSKSLIETDSFKAQIDSSVVSFSTKIPMETHKKCGKMTNKDIKLL